MNMSRPFLSFSLSSDNFPCCHMYITAGVRGLLLAVPVGTASFVPLLHSISNKCLFGDTSVVHRWRKYSTKQWLVHVHILTVVSVIIVSVITVAVIAYYDEETTTLMWISSLVSDVTIARSIVVMTISSIIPEIFHIEYVKTRNDNDHE
ncbi:hypothetical protein QTP88_011065 [Uroleucon formosanum]